MFVVTANVSGVVVVVDMAEDVTCVLTITPNLCLSTQLVTNRHNLCLFCLFTTCCVYALLLLADWQRDGLLVPSFVVRGDK